MSKIFRSIALASLFFISLNSYSQDKVLDSLQKALTLHTKKDTIRVNLLNNIATKLPTTDAEKALKLLKESETLANDLNFKKGKAYSLLFTGKSYINKGNYALATDYFQQSLELYEQLKDKEGIANSYLNMGRANYYLTNFPKALENFKQSSAISEEAGKLKILSNSLMIMGMIYNAQGDHENSIANYKKALSIDEKLDNKKGISATLINIGNLQKQQGDYTHALEAYNRSLDLKKQLNDEYGIASILNNIGTLYQEIENYKESLVNYQKALPIFEKLKSNRDVLGCLSNIGVIMMNQNNPKALAIFKKALRLSGESNDPANSAVFTVNIGGFYYLNNNFDESLKYYEKAVKIQKQIGAKRELSYSYLNIGRIFYAKKEYEKALAIANEGKSIAKELKLLNYQTDFSLLLSEIYYSMKEYKLAYENRQIHNELNDSIYKKENIDKLAQIKYKFAYKDTLNTANKNVNTLKKSVAVSQVQKKWLIGGIIGVLIALGFLSVLLKIRKIKMQNQQLLIEQKLLITQMNPHFIFNSIDNIQGLIYNKQDNDAINYLSKFSKLTRQILENSNENYISLSEEVEMIENYIALQQLLYNNKFDYTINVENSIETDSILLPPMLTQPFIENAIKHGLNSIMTKGLININFYLKDAKLFFEVLDNGKGFDQKKNVSNHKSLAMTITKERLVYYTKNQDFEMKTNNIMDQDKNVIGAQVIFEIPYIYEK